MASYFFKLKVAYKGGYATGHYDKTVILDFEKFEKVNSSSIYSNLKENIGHNDYDIINVVKL